jgi:hypothetical protein
MTVIAGLYDILDARVGYWLTRHNEMHLLWYQSNLGSWNNALSLSGFEEQLRYAKYLE